MRFIVMVKATKDSEAGVMPSTQLLEDMTKFNEELAKAGALLSLDGLHPGFEGTRVSFSGGRPAVMDGRLAEGKAVVGGYWMIESKSKEEAVEWAKRCPAADGDVIEVRRVFEISEFPKDVREAADNPTVRARLEKRKAS